MKKILVLTLCLAFLLSLSSCKKDDSSSSQVASSSSEANSTSSSAPQSTSSPSSSASSTSTANTSTIDSSKWPTSLITVISTTGEPVVLELKAPTEWDADATTVFVENEKKVLEIVALSKISDTANPFSFEEAEFFTKTPDDLPDDLGHIEKKELTLLDNKAELHVWKMYPADSETLWYPHYYFVQKDEYAIILGFYPTDENYQAQEPLYESILNTISILK